MLFRSIILTASPFIAGGAISLLSPHFYGDVIHEPFIQMGLAGMGGWILIGNVIMRRMVDMRI